MALALMGVLLLVVGIGVKIWDYKRKREAEAVQLQSQISDALLREAGLLRSRDHAHRAGGPAPAAPRW